jgi:hypothetical protein
MGQKFLSVEATQRPVRSGQCLGDTCLWFRPTEEDGVKPRPLPFFSHYILKSVENDPAAQAGN